MWLVIALLAGPAWTDAGVTRAIKKAERAGFEQHDLDGLMALMRPGARWINGRRADPDAHDVVLPIKTARAVLRLVYTGPPGTRRVDFLKTTVDLNAKPPTVELLVSRRSRGGRALARVAFELAQDEKGWGVVSRREWPLEERMGPMPTLLDDAFWLDADAAVEQPGTDTLSERFNALLEARRYAQLIREAKVIAGHHEEDAALWSLWAQAAYRTGDLDEARRLAKIARSKGASPGVPPALIR